MSNPLTDYDGSEYQLRPKVKRLFIIIIFFIFFGTIIGNHIQSKNIDIEIINNKGKNIKKMTVELKSMERKTIYFYLINNSPFDVSAIITSSNEDIQVNYTSIMLLREVKTYVLIDVFNPTVDNIIFTLWVGGVKT